MTKLLSPAFDVGGSGGSSPDAGLREVATTLISNDATAQVDIPAGITLADLKHVRFHASSIIPVTDNVTATFQIVLDDDTRYTTANQHLQGHFQVSPDDDSEPEYTVTTGTGWDISSCGNNTNETLNVILDTISDITTPTRPLAFYGQLSQYRQDTIMRTDMMSWHLFTSKRPKGLYLVLSSGNISSGRLSVMVAT